MQASAQAHRRLFTEAHLGPSLANSSSSFLDSYHACAYSKSSYTHWQDRDASMSMGARVSSMQQGSRSTRGTSLGLHGTEVGAGFWKGIRSHCAEGSLVWKVE